MKLTKNDLAQCKSLTRAGDKDAALALFRNSVSRGHRGKACARFLFAKSLGAVFTAEDVEYQKQAWAALGKHSKDRVRSGVEQLLKSI